MSLKCFQIKNYLINYKNNSCLNNMLLLWIFSLTKMEVPSYNDKIYSRQQVKFISCLKTTLFEQNGAL